MALKNVRTTGNNTRNSGNGRKFKKAEAKAGARKARREADRKACRDY